MRYFSLKRFLRSIAAVLAAAFVFVLTGCGGGSGGGSFTWFVDTIPTNLDPQVASAASDVIACENLYGGLVRRNADGELVPDLCEGWTVSPDGKTYTFTIKSGLTYTAAKDSATAYAITAQDFVFAFRRIFQAQTSSPYAVDFAAIENSAAVLAGELDESALGVSASGENTLVFRLSEKDDNFLAKLTLPGAMPCDEEFFNSTKGTYGLSTSTTLASGSFYIYNWTANGLFLRRAANGSYIDNLRLVQNTSNSGKSAAQLIADEKCSAALDDTDEETSLRAVNYSDTTWALLFNAGIDYRTAAGDPTPALSAPKALYLAARQGMASSDFNGVSILVPKGTGLTELVEQINGAWQKECSLFFSVEEVEREEFDARIAAGQYTIAFAPIHAEGGSVYQMLQQFSGEGSGLTGYTDPVYTERLALSAQQTGSARCQLLAQCEHQLLESGTVIPLFAQQKRLLIADGIDGLVFDPFTPVLDLTYTQKN